MHTLVAGTGCNAATWKGSLLTLIRYPVADSVKYEHGSICEREYADQRPEAFVQDADCVFQEAPSCQRGFPASKHPSPLSPVSKRSDQIRSLSAHSCQLS